MPAIMAAAAKMRPRLLRFIDVRSIFWLDRSCVVCNAPLMELQPGEHGFRLPDLLLNGGRLCVEVIDDQP